MCVCVRERERRERERRERERREREGRERERRERERRERGEPGNKSSLVSIVDIKVLYLDVIHHCPLGVCFHYLTSDSLVGSRTFGQILRSIEEYVGWFDC